MKKNSQPMRSEIFKKILKKNSQKILQKILKKFSKIMKKLNHIESVDSLIFAVLLNSGVTINNFRLIGEPLKGTAQPFSKRILFSSGLNEWIFSNDKMKFDECIQYSKKEIQDFNEFYWVDKELLRVVKKLLKSIGYNSGLFQVVIIIMYFRNSRKLLKLPNNNLKREHSVARLLELLYKEETCNKNSLIIKSNNLTLFEKFDNETLKRAQRIIFF
ncbi:MAG: hypothetical protein IPK10_15915 [Bacteroidetes bacterium]|nr:hypothetical protein [Bacteroidota bacterium]